MVDLTELAKEAQDRLKPKRYRHVVGVVETARELAEQHGVDIEQTQRVAWLHDFGKAVDRSTMQSDLKQWRVSLDPETWTNPKLWHGFWAGYVAEHHWGIACEEELQAIRWHATGSPGFGVLGHILFVADYCEPGRTVENREGLLDYARRDLAGGARLVARAKITYLLNCDRIVHPAAIAYWNTLVMGHGVHQKMGVAV